ncbi:MAG TPA: thioesterase family protein, partial [Acidimicrobiia bacterium]|nr:thioesterase family protein [Acidimicrobiia bacterium]
PSPNPPSPNPPSPLRLRFDVPVDPRSYPFTHRVRVRFAETDAMAVAHHSAHLLYLEEARVEYLRALGHPYDAVRAEGFEFPVLEVAVRYVRALRFDDVIDVHVTVHSVGAATFQMSYLLRAGGEVCAAGVTVHGVVGRDGRAARAPGWLRELAGPEGPA